MLGCSTPVPPPRCQGTLPYRVARFQELLVAEMQVAAPSTGRRISYKGLFAVAVWGASFVATGFALNWLTPFALVAVRTWLGVAVLAVALRARDTRLWPARRDVPLCAFLGAVLGVHLYIQARGLLYTSAIHTGWIIGFIPVCIAVGAHLLRTQRLHGRGWLGVAIGTLGVLTVAVQHPPDLQHAAWGDLLQFVSCLTWTVYTLAAVAPIAREGVLRVTTFGMGVAAVMTSAFALPTGVVRGPLGWPAIAAVLFLGLVCSGLAFYAWFAAQREHGPTRLGALLYLEPLATLAVARTIGAERIQITAVVGGALVLCGVWLVARGTSAAPAAQ